MTLGLINCLVLLDHYKVTGKLISIDFYHSQLAYPSGIG